MTDPHDVQALVDETHDWAERLLDRGACPACLAQALVGEGCFLAQSFGALALAKGIAGRYTDDGQSLCKH